MDGAIDMFGGFIRHLWRKLQPLSSGETFLLQIKQKLAVTAANIQNSGCLVRRQAIVIPFSVSHADLLEIPPLVQPPVERVVVALKAQVLRFIAKAVNRVHCIILRLPRTAASAGCPLLQVINDF